MVAAESPTDTRQRIVAATTELFRRQGFNGTSLSQIVKASSSTTGSLYHFFPGGKDELTAEVLAVSGESYRQLVELVVSGALDGSTAMTDAFEGAGALMAESDFIDPCPIGTIAREVASTHEPLREVANAVIESWVDTVVMRFVADGLPRDRAVPLARLAVASIEGGFVMARASKNLDAFHQIGQALRDAVERELAAQ